MSEASTPAVFDAAICSPDLKVKILEIGYKQIAEEIKRAEDQEHRVTFLSCTLLLLVSSWTFSYSAPDKRTHIFALSIVAAYGLLFAGFTCLYLYRNGTHAVLLYRDLIRIEEILGLHEPNKFVDSAT